jgi:hypothetical protein
MSLLDRLEKRFGAYSPPGLTLWILAGQAMVFVSQYIGPRAQPGVPGGAAAGIYEALALDPQQVIAGEWWRLLTFPFLAPLGQFPLFVLFYFWFLYFIGTTLEGAWGSFRFNAYLALGYLATVAAAFIAYAVAPGGGLAMADFLYGSLFLAFARLYPDFEILMFFILPVKVKWLARLQWAFYWYVVIFGDWFSRLTVLAAIFNYLIFFGRDVLREMKHGRRQMQRKAKTLKEPAKVLHECRVCGLTSAMAPKAAFRYCSQCAGQCCYCPEHIKDHEHVADDKPQ